MEKRSPLKDQPLRLPGQSVQDHIDRLADEKLLFYILLIFVVVGMALWEWYRWYFQPPTQPVFFTIVAVGISAFAVWRIFAVRKRFRALRLGRDGERAVAEVLDSLRKDGAIVFHDLRGPDFNVDHMIVSLNGIFVVETKTYSKRPGAKVIFDGRRLEVQGVRLDRDPIEQVRALARWVAKSLREGTGKDFRVRPVLVFPGWFVNPVREQGNSDVWVLNPEALPGFVRNERSFLSDNDFRDVVVQVARIARST